MHLKMPSAKLAAILSTGWVNPVMPSSVESKLPKKRSKRNVFSYRSSMLLSKHRNIKMHLQFTPLLNIGMTQVAEILPRVRQEPTYST